MDEADVATTTADVGLETDALELASARGSLRAKYGGLAKT